MRCRALARSDAFTCDHTVYEIFYHRHRKAEGEQMVMDVSIRHDCEKLVTTRGSFVVHSRRSYAAWIALVFSIGNVTERKVISKVCGHNRTILTRRFLFS